MIIGYHPRVGGYGRHVNLISKELRKRGHKVEILSTDFSPAPVKNERGVKRFWSTVQRITPGLFSHLLNSDYDVVHVHGYPSFQPFISALAARFKKFPLVFTPHFHPFGTKPLPLRKVFDSLFGVPSLRAAAKVIALSDYEKGLLSQYVPKDRISVIPNPVVLSELKRFKGFKKKHQLGKFVLFVGRLERDKGLNYLIDAVRDLDLVIIGRDVGFKSELKSRSNVHLLGEVSQRELMSAYSECSLVVLPSKYEAFGIVFIEAMSYGKPVIGSSVGPVPSIIGQAGFTVPYGDVKALRKVIKKALSSDLRSKALKQSKQYDIVKVVNSLEKVYGEVV